MFTIQTLIKFGGILLYTYKSQMVWKMLNSKLDHLVSMACVEKKGGNHNLTTAGKPHVMYSQLNCLRGLD